MRKGTFEFWWNGYATRVFLSLPWVKGIARDAYFAGRKSKGKP